MCGTLNSAANNCLIHPCCMLYLHPLTRDTGGGDGLFAVRDIQPDTVISFYHGELIGPGQNSDNPCTGRRDIGGSVEMFLSGILIKTESECRLMTAGPRVTPGPRLHDLHGLGAGPRLALGGCPRQVPGHQGLLCFPCTQGISYYVKMGKIPYTLLGVWP